MTKRPGRPPIGRRPMTNAERQRRHRLGLSIPRATKDIAISRTEIDVKLRPLVEALEIEGTRNLATMSPHTVAVLAGRLAKLLDEWEGRK